MIARTVLLSVVTACSLCAVFDAAAQQPVSSLTIHSGSAGTWADIRDGGVTVKNAVGDVQIVALVVRSGRIADRWVSAPRRGRATPGDQFIPADQFLPAGQLIGETEKNNGRPLVSRTTQPGPVSAFLMGNVSGIADGVLLLAVPAGCSSGREAACSGAATQPLLLAR